MSRQNDTIAALATPAGTSALAVIRISGPNTPGLATAIAGRRPQPRVATHVNYHAGSGALIDDVILTFFQGPRSYTGEDALEISSHGNPFIAQRILEDLFARGCRPAEPGEFTQRAFLSGRMDLSQAEAVMDIIQARSERALAAAQAQLRGALGRTMAGLVDALLAVLAQIEAYIDFPEEDLPPENLAAVLEQVGRIILVTSDLRATSRYGEILRDGMKTILLGAPNAGKSSLMNALVGRDRALVSAEPGTTRDFIEERILVGPHALRLIDTAGLNASPAPLERLGIEKTCERAAEADLFLFVIDGSAPTVPGLPEAVSCRMSAENTIVILNKSDLTPTIGPLPVPDHFHRLAVSALRGTGLAQLRDAITAKADRFAPQTDGSAIAINARHGHALTRANSALAEATAKLRNREPIELAASDLRAALDAFGEITGRVDNERMLDQLFASFCIGK